MLIFKPSTQFLLFRYFFGTRLYREVPKTKPKKKKADEEEPKAKSAKVEREPKKPGWSLACSTPQEWENLTGSYKKSKRKQDKELYETLNENFLPDILKMFADKEREERIKIMMMNRRTSSRIDKKRVDQEEAERRNLMRIEEEMRKVEETRIKQEKENRENLLKARGERAKQRQEQRGASKSQLSFQFLI